MHKFTHFFLFGAVLLAFTAGTEIGNDSRAARGLLPESTVIADAGTASGGMILADRVEKDDRVVYGTDPDPAFSQAEQEKEEKEKEEQSWRMLEHMNLLQGNGKKATTPNSSQKQ